MTSNTDTPPRCPLYIIPARGGSKGIPRKNIKPLGGHPLIEYSLRTALRLAPDRDHIILSTDDEEIAGVAEQTTGLTTDYRRPASLATDTSGTREVIIDAMDYADSRGIVYDCVVLLQPTSPLRADDDVRRCISMLRDGDDMVVSVVPAASNPYYNCFETDPATGWLHISKGDGMLTRRQDAPPAWEYDGAIYVINPQSIRAKQFGQMACRRPCPVDPSRSVDLDTPRDWAIAEFMLSQSSSSL